MSNAYLKIAFQNWMSKQKKSNGELYYSAEHTYRQSLFVVSRRVQEPARNDKIRRFLIVVAKIDT